MSRSAVDRVTDIIQAIERCRRYVDILEADQGDRDRVRMAEDAIERNLQIVGEAANHLPAEVLERYDDIPWPQIRGLRNILVHEYFGVDIDIVRDVVENHLSYLAARLDGFGE